MNILEPGDRLVVSLSRAGGPYACVAPAPLPPGVSQWWDVVEPFADATDFGALGLTIDEAYTLAGEASRVIGGRLVRLIGAGS